MRIKAFLICWLIFFSIYNSNKSFSQTRSSSQPSKSNFHNTKLVMRGAGLFKAYQCLDCHKLAGKGCIDGISLDGEGELRSTAFLTEQLEDPEKHAAKTLNGLPGLMTPPNMSKDEVQAVVAYLKSLKLPKKVNKPLGQSK